MNTSGPQTTAAHPSSAESNCLPLPCAFGAAEASDSIGGGEQKKNSNTYVSTESGEVQTSNKGFEEWGQILGDEVMAAALIDRLLHHCHIVNIRGSSYRMRKHTDLSKILHSPPAESSPSPPKRKRARAKEKTTN